MNLLKSLNDKGYTILMVTHNTEQSLEADKIIRIADGQIISVKSNEVEAK